MSITKKVKRVSFVMMMACGPIALPHEKSHARAKCGNLRRTYKESDFIARRGIGSSLLTLVICIRILPAGLTDSAQQ